MASPQPPKIATLTLPSWRGRYDASKRYYRNDLIQSEGLVWRVLVGEIQAVAPPSLPDAESNLFEFIARANTEGAMTGAEIVAAIDAELGSDDWRTGGGGGGGAVDLAVTQDDTTVTVTPSGGGDAAVLPAATATDAGVMAAADKSKLDGIEASADVNVGTDLALANRDSDSLDITSNTGADVTIPSATQTLAGLQSAADKLKLDGIEAAADVTDAANVDAAGAVMEGDYQSQSILGAINADTPINFAFPASTLFGRKATGDIGVLTAAETRTMLSLVIGTNIQAWDAQLDSLSAASANGVSLVTAADYAAMRSLLSLGTAALVNTGVTGATVPLINGTIAWSGQHTWSNASVPVQSINTADSASNRGLNIFSRRATPTNNDVVILGMFLRNTTPADIEAGRISAQMIDVTPSSEDSQLLFGTMKGGTHAARIIVGSDDIRPNVDGAILLGTAAAGFGGVHFNTGADINFENGNWLAEHSSGVLDITAGELRVGGNRVLDTTDLLGTDLAVANRDADSLDITSSTGADVTIPSASTTEAGLMSAADKVALDGFSGGGSALPPGFICGLKVSNGTDTTNDLNVTSGRARDSTNTVDIILPADMGKQLDVGWAAGGTPGSPAGGRNSGIAIADGTYHVYLVAKAAGADADIYFHTSTDVATVITALQAESGGASYLYAKRIASIKRVSGAWKQFRQRGDFFEFDVSTVIVVAGTGLNSIGTSATTRTATDVPTGISTIARIVGYMRNAGVNSSSFGLWTALDQTDTAPSGAFFTICDNSSGGTDQNINNVEADVALDTSAQFRTRYGSNSSSITIALNCRGWFDRRGQDGDL